jgi:hypothetical protein
MAMEHRWGERIYVNIAVRLRCPIGGIATGQLMNYSKSGAFIRTSLDLPFAVPVDILIGGQEIGAYVVRNSPEGFAVEWRTVAPSIGIGALQPSTQPQDANTEPTAPTRGLDATPSNESVAA